MTGMEWGDDCPWARTVSRAGVVPGLFGIGEGVGQLLPFPMSVAPRVAPRPQPQEPHQSGSRRSPVRKLC